MLSLFLRETDKKNWACENLQRMGKPNYRSAPVAALVTLKPLPARDGQPVTLRMAGSHDAEMMFRWQIDDRTRRYASRKNPPGKNIWLGSLGISLRPIDVFALSSIEMRRPVFFGSTP